MKHYTTTELDRFRTKRMTMFQQVFCHLHLFRCADCRKRLEGLLADDQLLAEVKDSLRRLDVAPNESTYRILCRKFHNEPNESSSR